MAKAPPSPEDILYMQNCKRVNTIGFHSRRLNDDTNTREIKLAKNWEKYNKSNSPIMDYLVPDQTERDQRVAATIIQWLGTNVGRAFLEESNVLQYNIGE